MKNNSHTLASTTAPRSPVSDQELQAVIADFLAMGHVDNIIAMFRHEPRYHQWTGKLLEDERFAVRLGLAVCYEQLVIDCPDDLHLAVPSLAAALSRDEAWIRGEAVSLLGTIGGREALELVATMKNDPSAQVVEIVTDILNESHHG